MTTNNIRLSGGSVFNSSSGELEAVDLLVEDGLITRGPAGADWKVLDCEGLLVVPGGVTFHDFRQVNSI